jgi:hypothetical protein
MRVTQRHVLADTWLWDNNAWKGEIVLDVYCQSRPAYRMLDFDTLYAEWFNSVKEVEEDDLTNLEVFQSTLHTIYQDFEYYRSDLGKLFDSLSTEKKERFKNGIRNIWDQYNLLLEHAWNSNEDFEVLLDFLKELPARMRFILRRLASQEVEVVVPEPKQFSPTGKFLEGERYKELEETGCSQSLFLRLPMHTNEVV